VPAAKGVFCRKTVLQKPSEGLHYRLAVEATKSGRMYADATGRSDVFLDDRTLA
jgi:hypothetical protein